MFHIKQLRILTGIPQGTTLGSIQKFVQNFTELTFSNVKQNFTHKLLINAFLETMCN